MTDLLRRYTFPGLALAGLGLCLILGPNLALSGQGGEAESPAADRLVLAQGQDAQGQDAGQIQTVPRVSPRSAAQNAGKGATTKTGSSAKAPSTTWTASESGNRACVKARRRIWQEGEGWMVKTVTTCP